MLSIIIIAAVIAIALSIVVVKSSGRSSTPKERPGSDDFDAQINQLKGQADDDAGESDEEKE